MHMLQSSDSVFHIGIVQLQTSLSKECNESWHSSASKNGVKKTELYI